MQETTIKKIASELLEEIFKTSRPASEIINSFTRTHKSFGSKDRRLLSDIVWGYIRHKSRLDFAFPKLSTLEKIEKVNSVSKKLPSKTPLHVQYEVPAFLINKINPDELVELLKTPDIILRANGDRSVIQKKLAEEGIETSQTPLSPYGLILNKRTNLNATKTFKDGLVEIQDEGSQLVALQTNIKPFDTVLDYCAGAGGKSLIFAQMMQNKGQIVAHDISQRSLKELEKRALRAKTSIIKTTTHLKQFVANEKITFSHVVVDAPCSGTGTWRRCPDARWKLTEDQLAEIIKKQAQILRIASSYVNAGGYLSYMTCSLLEEENIQQIRAFLKQSKTFKLCTHKQFSPAKTKTDGLFVAVLQKQKN